MADAAEWGASDYIEQAELREFASSWARLWSKLLDVNIWGLPLAMLAGYMFPAFVSQPQFQGAGGSALLGAFILPFSLAIDAIVLAAFGNTPGRALVGIRVETIRHDRLDAATALNRNARIYLFGMALGFPLAALFTYFHNSSKLKNREQTSWDGALNTRVYNIGSKLPRTVLVAVLVLGMNVVGSVLDRIEEEKARTASEQSVDPIEVQMKAEAAEIKPQMVDEITRLDGAEVEGRVLTYFYTILRRDVSDEAFGEFFRAEIVPNLCENTDTASLMRDYQFAYQYQYMMPNAEQPLTYRLTWVDCK